MILYEVKKDGKWGFIDQAGKEIIPCINDDVSILVVPYLIYTIKSYITKGIC